MHGLLIEEARLFSIVDYIYIYIYNIYNYSNVEKCLLVYVRMVLTDILRRFMTQAWKRYYTITGTLIV